MQTIVLKGVKYDQTWEEPVARQIKRMQEITQRDYYEIWIGGGGYAVPTTFEQKLYDTYHDDDSILVEKTGLTHSEFLSHIIPRCGCLFSFTPERYQEKTGQPFPDYIDDPSVTMVNFAEEWFSEHHFTP